MNELIEIGYIRKTHGYKGVVKILIHDHLDLEDGIQAFFLEKKGEQLPYFPESIGFNSSGELLVKLEGVDSSETAALLRGSTVLVNANKIIRHHEPTDAPDLVGYTLHDMELGAIGAITEILEMPGHDVLSLDHDGREVMIPLHEELIESIDQEQRIILFNLPEGILDL